MSNVKQITAIAIIPDKNGNPIRALKYRNIQNNEHGKNSFYAFIKEKFPGVGWVNWYEKNSTFGKAKIQGRFIEKIYLQ